LRFYELRFTICDLRCTGRAGCVSCASSEGRRWRPATTRRWLRRCIQHQNPLTRFVAHHPAKVVPWPVRVGGTSRNRHERALLTRFSDAMRQQPESWPAPTPRWHVPRPGRSRPTDGTRLPRWQVVHSGDRQRCLRKNQRTNFLHHRLSQSTEMRLDLFRQRPV